MSYRIEVYRDRRREWRWRLLAPNGRVTATSGEGYTRRAAAFNAAARVRDQLACAPILLIDAEEDK